MEARVFKAKCKTRKRTLMVVFTHWIPLQTEQMGNLRMEDSVRVRFEVGL